MMNAADYLLEHIQSKDKIAIITSKASYTYQDLLSTISSYEEIFHTLGLGSGDKIGIFSTNSMFWVASYLAILKIGATAVPFATTLTLDQFIHNISCIELSLLCIEERLFRRYSSAISMLNLLFEDSSVKRVNEKIPEGKNKTNETEGDAALMFTSGTTLTPRLVRITHKNIQANTTSIIKSLNLDQSQRILVVLPFYYCFGTSLLHTHLRTGATLVISEGMIYPEKVLDLMEETECTGFAGVPSTYQVLLRNSSFPKRPIKNLKKIQQAGGKLSTILINELINCRPDSEIYIMYGQTEATARLSCLPPQFIKEKIGSIGKGIPGVQLRVIDNNGVNVKPGEVGEIMAIGDNISPGYLNEPEANAEKFKGGCLYTGDFATVDEDDFIYIVDRKSDFIKSYGNRVSSQEIESCVLELNEVVSAAVIGVPDLIKGEAIIAFLTVKSEVTLSPNHVIKHIAKHLPSYMVPSEVMIVDNLPLNANGKVIKSELRNLYENRSGAKI